MFVSVVLVVVAEIPIRVSSAKMIMAKTMTDPFSFTKIDGFVCMTLILF